MKLRGAEIVVEILKEKNIKTVFGYPGGTVAALYDELYKHRNEIKHIRTAHEQGAAHAADGFARMTGKASVCISTSGPGATNLVTGIATAFADSVPVVFITANVPVSQIGTDSFQEVDITGITIPITKYNKMVKDGSELCAELRKAFEIAESGRKGPVLIDIPKDVLEKQFDFYPPEDNGNDKKQSETVKGDVESTVKIISESKKPFILAGGGVRISGASKQLYEFAELTGAPVCCTMMALGEFPESNRRYVGSAGAFAGEAVRKAVSECDLFIAVGSRFSSKTELSEKILKDKMIIHIDTDRAEINKNVAVSSYIVGDAAIVLEKICGCLKKSGYVPSAEVIEWTESLSELKKSKKDEKDSVFSMKTAIKTVAEKKMFDTVVTDVGLHQVTAAAFYGFEKPGSFVTSGGLGTMGFGLGASIGVYEAAKGRVLLITGDGSFGMEMQELATLRRYNIPVTVLIMNNGALGMVKSIQKKRFSGRFSETLIKKNEISFRGIAKACGINAEKVTNAQSLGAALEKYKNIDGPAVIDCRIK